MVICKLTTKHSTQAKEVLELRAGCGQGLGNPTPVSTESPLERKKQIFVGNRGFFSPFISSHPKHVFVETLTEPPPRELCVRPISPPEMPGCGRR